jgi:sugar phosphate isomerase/epimerase
VIVGGGAAPPLHLTYCTNIHPGESWDEVFANVATHVVAVKARVSPTRPFGVGLRLSAAAARRLAEPEVLAEFRQFLRDRQLYVFTINGFPYGPFHGTPVKENVYRPDWLEDERVAYSDQLAELLAALVPEDLEGSVSTVPGCFAERASGDSGARMAARLRRHALGLWHLRERTGRTITLALEPEPHCVMETSGDAVGFFQRHLFSAESTAAFARDSGLAPAAAEEVLRRHLGVCLDACHAAVEFEEPAEALRGLGAAGIRILKVQVSAGLRVVRPDAAALAALERFAEGVYLHQVVVRTGETLRRVLDLPQALAEAKESSRTGALGDEWRIHFHVPLFQERLGPFQNTTAFLDELLPMLARTDATRHLEVETYTRDVLPEEHRHLPVDEAIARELTWAKARLHP